MGPPFIFVSLKRVKWKEVGLCIQTVSHGAAESESCCLEDDGNSAGMCEKMGTTLDSPFSPMALFELI